MDRKPIFDAVRRLLGGRLAQSQVAEIDRAIDHSLVPADPAAAVSDHVLGALSERYECGELGPGAVSSGRNDPGGVSYGLYQLASKTGTCAAFVAAEGAAWQARWGGAVPGSPAFSAAWRAVAAAEGPAFAAAQRAFIARTHYRPAVAAVLARCGIDLDGRHDAVRDACWSVAVQHGGAARILAAAVSAADAKLARDAAGYDRALVDAIYDARSAYVLQVAARPGLGAGERGTLTGLVARRFAAERAEALAMLGSSGSGTSGGAAAPGPVGDLAHP